MKRSLFTVSMLLFFITSNFARTSKLKLQEYRKIINEINSMDLERVVVGEITQWDAACNYYDKSGLLRKHISRYGGESEQCFFISLYGKSGDAIFLAYRCGNNVEDEKGCVYLNKNEIILQNSVVYPYYDEYYDEDGRLVVDGIKDSLILKTSGTFTYSTPLFGIDLSMYAHVDSLQKYYEETALKTRTADNPQFVMFSNAAIASVTVCNEGLRSCPSMSCPMADSVNINIVSHVKVLERGKGEVIGSWGFNYWYKVEFGEVGYIYGAFLEPIETFSKCEAK